METVRFIPAGAGNSINWERLITATAVYPRWRGELRLNNAAANSNAGLSPLARGTHQSRKYLPC